MHWQVFQFLNLCHTARMVMALCHVECSQICQHVTMCVMEGGQSVQSSVILAGSPLTISQCLVTKAVMSCCLVTELLGKPDQSTRVQPM